MNKNFALLALTGVLTLASCGQNSSETPKCSNGQTLVNGVCVAPTINTGVLNLVADSSYTSVVKDASGNTVVSSSYSAMAPGAYTVTFSKSGYNSQTTGFNIIAGQTTTVQAPVLTAVGTTTKAKGAYYVDGNGNLVAIPATDLTNADKFVFYAWMKNAGGSVKDASGSNLTFGTLNEGDKNETAPSFTQNLATAYVGYKAADGKTYPVAGAGVRWTITGTVAGDPGTSVIFGGADDGSNDTNFNPGVTPQSISAGSKQADTITNSSALANTPFPTANTSTTPYYLNNVTGVNSPNYNGLTWVTLFSPNAQASAKVVAVATIGDMEIGKQIVNKTFAPKPNLTITKTFLVNGQPVTNPQSAPINSQVTLRISVTNNGAGDATNVRLTDRLISGDANAYSIATLPANVAKAQDNDGFDATFNLASKATQNFDFPVTSSAAGTYCDTATLVSYENSFFSTPDLQSNFNQTANQCAIFLAPQVNIAKWFTDAAGNRIDSVTSGSTAVMHVKVTNSGGANANVTSVVDALEVANSTTALTDAQGNVINKPGVTPAAPVALVGNDNNYTVSAFAPTSATANANDGFNDGTAFTLTPGQSREYTANVVATLPDPTKSAKYCDMAAVNSNGGNATTEACLTVTQPQLTITKSNDKTTVVPGDNYTSTITVTNNGSGDATGVQLKDLLGSSNSRFVTYGNVTYSLAGASDVAGFFDKNSNTVYANSDASKSVTIPAGKTLVLKVTSTLPANAQPGTYCDFASFSSTNAGAGQAAACVTANYFAALQTNLKDTIDPFVANGGATADGKTSYITALYNQPRSNEAVSNNTVTYTFGSDNAGIAGSAHFNNPASTEVWYDATPTNVNGALSSDSTHSTAVKLNQGSDYTITTNSNGTQTIKINKNLDINQAFFIIHNDVTANQATTAKQYWTNYVWSNTGAASGNSYEGTASEPTTIK